MHKHTPKIQIQTHADTNYIQHHKKKCKTETKKDTESGGKTYISFVGPRACWAPASAETNYRETNIMKNVKKLIVSPILLVLKKLKCVINGRKVEQ